MLVARVEKENVKYYIYVKKELNNYIYYGYSEENNIHKRLSETDIDFFKDYILNLENIELDDNYKVYLTNDKKLLDKLKKNEANLFNQLLNSKYSSVPIAIFSLMLTLTISISGLTLLEKYNNLKNEVIDLKKEIYSGQIYTSKDVYVGELDSNKIKELINSSINLNQEEKDGLINEDFYEFIDDYIDSYVVYPRLENIDIVDFTDEEKNDKKNEDSAGFYDYRQPNILHVRDYDENNTLNTMVTNFHEESHMLQSDFEYSYLVEGTVALFTNEFCDSSRNSYPERQKRLKVLMEIIGTEPILKYYGGSFNEIEDNLNKYLTKKEVEEFKSLLKTGPYYKKIDEVHEKIDKLLSTLYHNKYNCDIKDDDIINAIYNNLVVSRNYFNITNEKDIILENLYDLDEINKKDFNINDKLNTIELEPFPDIENNPYVTIINKVKSRVLTDEEYEILLLTKMNAEEYINNIYYYNYPYKYNTDGNYIFNVPVAKRDENNSCYIEEQEVVVTLDEAIKRGYITVKRHYNTDINGGIRLSDSGKLYNNIIVKGDYSCYYFNGKYMFGKYKEIPTINDKFNINNDNDKKIKVK